MPKFRFRSTVSLVALALTIVEASCASAKKRLEQGEELEHQGRPAEAARRYIEALRKDAGLAQARRRLLETGTYAIADYLRQADALEATGVHTDAADVLRTADALIRSAAGVGVALRAPPEYAEKRELVLRRAVEQ